MSCKSIVFKIYILFQALAFPLFSQQNQYNYFYPVDIPLSVSGSFGELRTNSFHMGLDFKTMGTIGLNVYSIEDGYVVRIKIETGGYGKAIYINHPNGFTSVYAHLEGFPPEIEQYCKEEQYKKKHFAVDMMFTPGKIPVKKGQVIGLSGNRGASSGPHLHFEIRETKTEFPINILKYTNITIADNIAPVIDNIWVYPLTEASRVNNKTAPVRVSPRTSVKDDALFASGEIGLGIQVHDKTNTSLSKTGVYTTQLFVNDTVVFEQVFDKLSFSDVRYINSLMDYRSFISFGARINRLFVQPNNKLPVYTSLNNHGKILFSDTSTKRIRIVVKDEYSNQSEYSFSISGKGPFRKIPEPAVNTNLLSWKTENTFDNGDVKIIFPKDALYDDLLLDYAKLPRIPGYYSHLHKVHNTYTPLHKVSTISVKPVDLPEKLQSKALLVGINSAGNVNWAGGSFKNGRVEAFIRFFGNYIVGIDTVRPTIRPLFTSVRNKDFRRWGQIAFQVKDDLSGIAKYDGYIDDQWVLFEYDPKTNMLFYKFDASRMKFGGKHTLILKVSDDRGNSTEYTTEFLK